MPFSHYPKTVWNLLFAWRWPRPPKRRGWKSQPSFDRLNKMTAPLKPGESVVQYHDAQGFTRFMGTMYSDQPLEVEVAFSNDEVDDEGYPVTDENISKLHYDGLDNPKAYDPEKQAASGKIYVIIAGRWLRVSVTNKGKKPTEKMRVNMRGSVF